METQEIVKAIEAVGLVAKIGPYGGIDIHTVQTAQNHGWPIMGINDACKDGEIWIRDIAERTDYPYFKASCWSYGTIDARGLNRARRFYQALRYYRHIVR